nr:MAG TPA: Radical SAM superfamily [Caudoviricetes sp.]
MNNTFEKRSMAFMNCPWKFTAGCNLICETCLHSDPDGLRTLLDDFNRLGERLKIMEDKNG